jgi:hypothetical protein
MTQIALKQIYHKGITIRIPEIWNAETEDLTEEDGSISHCISISAGENDARSIDISFGPMPEDSDAYTEACGTYEDVVSEEELEVNDEPILCFDFKGQEAYGFSLATEDRLPCFFFCINAEHQGKTYLLTVLLCASGNDELQSLLDFVEEYISYQ